jgi:NAD(P)-dependent dehydrogenase (short-subunit alcohol dehydrogenase family)
VGQDEGLPASPTVLAGADGRLLLEDRVAVVTGGNRGIGAAIARCFAMNGARVAVAHGRETTVEDEALEDELLRHSSDALVQRADVSDPIQVEAFFDAVDQRLGPLDILVSNAAVDLRGPLADLAPESWERVMAVNLTGTVLCAQAAARRFARSGARGSIVTISSIRARKAWTGDAAYHASKGGIEALTRALAIELAPLGVRVNAIAPGTVLTDMNREVMADSTYRQRAIERIPLGRFGEASEVAAAILFLASPLAAWITGVVLPVDGGEVIRG